MPLPVASAAMLVDDARDSLAMGRAQFHGAVAIGVHAPGSRPLRLQRRDHL